MHVQYHVSETSKTHINSYTTGSEWMSVHQSTVVQYIRTNSISCAQELSTISLSTRIKIEGYMEIRKNREKKSRAQSPITAALL